MKFGDLVDRWLVSRTIGNDPCMREEIAYRAAIVNYCRHYTYGVGDPSTPFIHRGKSYYIDFRWEPSAILVQAGYNIDDRDVPDVSVATQDQP